MSTYKTYWSTWAVLLVLTILMLVAGSTRLSARAIAFLLLLGMAAKIGLIGANFMHLRYERLNLILTVALGIILTALALFLGIAPDGVRILNLSQP